MVISSPRGVREDVRIIESLRRDVKLATACAACATMME
jgi:hypothetical protein